MEVWVGMIKGVAEVLAKFEQGRDRDRGPTAREELKKS